MADFSEFIGLTLGVDVSVQEIKDATGRTVARLALPDSQLTMDLNPERVTIFVDYTYLITGIQLG